MILAYCVLAHGEGCLIDESGNGKDRDETSGRTNCHRTRFSDGDLAEREIQDRGDREVVFQ